MSHTAPAPWYLHNSSTTHGRNEVGSGPKQAQRPSLLPLSTPPGACLPACLADCTIAHPPQAQCHKPPVGNAKHCQKICPQTPPPCEHAGSNRCDTTWTTSMQANQPNCISSRHRRHNAMHANMKCNRIMMAHPGSWASWSPQRPCCCHWLAAAAGAPPSSCCCCCCCLATS